MKPAVTGILVIKIIRTDSTSGMFIKVQGLLKIIDSPRFIYIHTHIE